MATFALLYSTQALLPELSTAFRVSAAVVAVLTALLHLTPSLDPHRR